MIARIARALWKVWGWLPLWAEGVAVADISADLNAAVHCASVITDDVVGVTTVGKFEPEPIVVRHLILDDGTGIGSLNAVAPV